jgi:hypothetical protein
VKIKQLIVMVLLICVLTGCDEAGRMEREARRNTRRMQQQQQDVRR